MVQRLVVLVDPITGARSLLLRCGGRLGDSPFLAELSFAPPEKRHPGADLLGTTSKPSVVCFGIIFPLYTAHRVGCLHDFSLW
jgi:hypothetical protein